MRVQKITVKNLKSVDFQEINANGGNIIVTAGNNKGKTTVLASLIDRFRGEKPQLIVKQGQKDGYYEMELSDGSKIKWQFTQKSEKFEYTTKDGLTIKNGVITAIGKKYFGEPFDIDKFLSAPPKKQAEILQKIVGLDFSELDAKYKELYEQRTVENRELKRLRGLKLRYPIEVESPIPELHSLKSKIDEAKKENEKRKNKWQIENERHLQDLQNYNDEQRRIAERKKIAKEKFDKLLELAEYQLFADLINIGEANKRVKELPEPQYAEIVPLPEPEYIDTDALYQEFNKLQEKNAEYHNYLSDLERYNEWLENGRKQAEKVVRIENELKAIAKQKIEMIRNAEIPEGFDFDDNGLTFNGFPLDDNQVSTSQKYIAGLKLGSLLLGEVRTMHFDASTLDNNSLKKILEYADKNDIQLFIERPDYDGGEIRYEIINQKN